MSFYTTYKQFSEFDFQSFFDSVTSSHIEKALQGETLTEYDFLALLSPLATNYLERMAQKANRLTIQFFGRTIGLYIPLYISNFCTNECIYCGFNTRNSIARKKLTLEEIEKEAKVIRSTGMQHLLLLTGEAPSATSIEYLEDAVRLLKKYFASVSIEIFPMDTSDYRRLQEAGVDGLTLYQEVYNEPQYKAVHVSGRKADYLYRLDAPERGAKAGFRMINIGPLLGLGEIKSEVFFTGLHAKYLENNFLNTEIALSLPRMNPAEGDFAPEHIADDRSFVQFLTALRCYLPRAGISISTRESANFRDNLIGLGATRFSAGSSTGVGGYIDGREDQGNNQQFEITDERSVEEVVSAIEHAGYQPVYKDWDLI